MSESEHSEKEWVLRLQAGDEEAWSRFVDTFEDQVWRVICRTGGFREGEADQAGDIRQETFLAAINSIHRFAGRSKLGTWLCRIAWNKTVDHIREGRRRPLSAGSLDATNRETGEPLIDPPQALSNPAEDLVQKEQVEKLRGCLDRLRQKNERWWEIVTMYYYAELLYKDIADELDMPLGTVQGALFRARQFLGDCVDGNKAALPND